MRVRIILIIFIVNYFTVSVFCQSIGKVLDDLDYTTVKSTSCYNELVKEISLDSLNEKNQFVGFKDTTANCMIFYDIKHEIFIRPFYHRGASDSISNLSYFSIIDSDGFVLVNWYIHSNYSPINLIVLNLKNGQEIKYEVGRKKGGQSKFHGFSKKLFSIPTLDLNDSQFNSSVEEILKRHRKLNR